MKKFLIIGNLNAITYKEVFPLIKNNQMWLGVRDYALHDKQKNKNTYLIKDADGTINGKAVYARILIKSK